jgi:hypothetical protein
MSALEQGSFKNTCHKAFKNPPNTTRDRSATAQSCGCSDETRCGVRELPFHHDDIPIGTDVVPWTWTKIALHATSPHE